MFPSLSQFLPLGLLLLRLMQTRVNPDWKDAVLR
jgi:hypothetical protein